jgi:hypothetical protein
MDDKQTSVIHVRRDITFSLELIQQRAFVADGGGYMHEGWAKIHSRFQEDSGKDQ